jgi:hypothetical protein
MALFMIEGHSAKRPSPHSLPNLPKSSLWKGISNRLRAVASELSSGGFLHTGRLAGTYLGSLIFYSFGVQCASSCADKVTVEREPTTPLLDSLFSR